MTKIGEYDTSFRVTAMCTTSDGLLVLPSAQGTDVNIITTTNVPVRALDLSPGPAVGQLFGVSRKETTLFFSDFNGNSLHVSSETGTYYHKIPLSSIRPTGLVILGDTVFVVSLDDHTIYKILLDANNQPVSTEVVASGAPMTMPVGMSYCASRLTVTSYGSNNVVAFDLCGNQLLNYGSYGSGPLEVDRPYGSYVDQWGQTYFADRGNSRVTKLAANGSFIAHVIEAADGLSSPEAIAVIGDTMYLTRYNTPKKLYAFRLF